MIFCLALRMHNNTLLRRRDQGEKDWKRAVALSAKLKSWSDLCDAAWLDAHLGDHALAAARAAYLAKQKDLIWEDLYRLARAYAVAADAARKDTRLAPAERERTVEGYADETVRLFDRTRAAEPNLAPGTSYDFACFLVLAGRGEKAVALLSQLRREGFLDKAENLKMLRTNSDLDLLRKRGDFMKLVSDLGKPADRK